MTDFSQRDPVDGVSELLWQRWSPRAFTKTSIEPAVLTRIMDAARWAPSCFNQQPWRFHTSTDATFDAFLALLVEGNQSWAKDAAVLGFVVAKKQFDHNDSDNPYARFDAGAAWMALSLQARLEGLHTHGMGGIHADEAAAYLQIDSGAFEVVMGFAIGLAVEPAKLSEEQRARETPNARQSLGAIWQPH